ncbi:MAG: flagellar protein FlaG [Hormoscilla sp. GUM202]|nr:flagellar protein FlaG [Hormoscilla sp. GUM202]
MTSQINNLVADSYARNETIPGKDPLSTVERKPELAGIARSQQIELENNQEQQVAGSLSESEDKQAKIGEQSVTDAVALVEEFVSAKQKRVSFSIAEETGKMVIQIKDKDSQEVLRQIPAEEVLEMASRVQNLVDEIGQKTGILFEESV